jgi:hypothetical protein
MRNKKKKMRKLKNKKKKIKIKIKNKKKKINFKNKKLIKIILKIINYHLISKKNKIID